MERQRPGILTTVALALLTLGWPSKAVPCTSVCLATRDRVVFGNNLDWFVDDGLIVVNKRGVRKRGLWFSNPPEWTSRYASLTVNQDGREFPSRGMNEAGLVVGEMTLRGSRYPGRDHRPALSGPQWIQYLLDNCATVAEVIATDREIRIDRDEYPSHYFVCDAQGECVAMEWLEGALRASTGSSLPVKALANDTYERSLAGRHERNGRFAEAAHLLETHAGEEPVGYVRQILRSVSQESTVWSLIFDVTNRRLHYTTRRNPALRTVSLQDFDARCDAGTEILDVNGVGSGEQRESFLPFSVEANDALSAATFGKLSLRFGPFSQDFMKKLSEYPATTWCTTRGPAVRH